MNLEMKPPVCTTASNKMRGEVVFFFYAETVIWHIFSDNWLAEIHF